MKSEIQHLFEQLIEVFYSRSGGLSSIIPRNEFENLKTGLAGVVGEKLVGIVSPELQHEDNTGVEDSPDRLREDTVSSEAFPMPDPEFYLELTEALGACSCLGTDRSCVICHGLGRPGWTSPDPIFLNRLINPVLRRYRADRNFRIYTGSDSSDY